MLHSVQKKYLLCLYLLLAASTSCVSSAGYSHVKQEIIGSVARVAKGAFPEGLSGICMGKQGKWLILAGGSHFPNGKPWENGQKHFSDKIFVLSLGDLSAGMVERDSLRVGLAECACASVDKGVVFIGGQSAQGLSDQVFLLSYNEQTSTISIDHLPTLPFAVKLASATSIGNTVYVVGGQTNDGSSSNQCLRLDMDRLDKGWQVLAKYPLQVCAAGMVAQTDGTETAIFVFGGRNSTPNQETTTFYSQVNVFKPSEGKWHSRKHITVQGKTMALAAASAARLGNTDIVLLGGDNGQTFNQVEKAIHAHNIPLRNTLWQKHPGFSADILAYNTVTDSWFCLGNMDKPVAVSAIVSDDNRVYMVGGEQKPGIRSPFILRYSFPEKGRR